MPLRRESSIRKVPSRTMATLPRTCCPRCFRPSPRSGSERLRKLQAWWPSCCRLQLRMSPAALWPLAAAPTWCASLCSPWTSLARRSRTADFPARLGFDLQPFGVAERKPAALHAQTSLGAARLQTAAWAKQWYDWGHSSHGWDRPRYLSRGLRVWPEAGDISLTQLNRSYAHALAAPRRETATLAPWNARHVRTSRDGGVQMRRHKSRRSAHHAQRLA
mmetsp:Transcript_17344/g.65634  ORF Transcript_17344/g.65634 Transcript_17344/m.65634 type:complete len:219 (+) Transcript_17344:709-1365(+)